MTKCFRCGGPCSHPSGFCHGCILLDRIQKEQGKEQEK